MNVIAWLVFRLAYYDVAVQHICHYAMESTYIQEVSVMVIGLENRIVNPS